jgi:signal transduction histidine kinase/DNA-binding response OmpR family regulator
VSALHVPMHALVIEDDGATRAILISVLSARGHEVIACTDAESAWNAVASDGRPPFDLAVVEAGRPGQDGLGFCQRFRGHPAGRHATLLLVTSDDRTETLQAALGAGVHDYLLKPVDPRTLGIRLAIVEQRTQAEATTRRERDRAEVLLRVSRAMSEVSGWQATLQAVCDQTRLALGTSRSTVLLYRPHEKALRVEASSGSPLDGLPPSAFAPSPLWVHERIAPISVPVVALSDIRAMSFSPNFDLMWRAGHRSIVFVRMVHEGELVGIVAAAEIGRTREFAEEDQALLGGISEIGTVAIRNARLIEERRRTEERMRNARKLESLGLLAGGIAHDFNNLLVGVLGNAGLALMELPEEAPARQAVKDIQASAQRAADLTGQMLAYSGKGRFLVEPVNLSRVVEDMTHQLSRVISNKARLELHLAPDLPVIGADGTQVGQVVMNLITNASDALGGKPGLITLTTTLVDASAEMLASTYLNEQLPPGPYVCLVISDTGIGMDEQTRARIFEPFFTTKVRGRGLGLAAVLGIVRGHRGAIDVRSEVGGGTTFRLLFPATLAGIVADAATAAPARYWKSTGDILLVDDEEAVRGLATRVLERSGFRVVQAASGEEALRYCAELTPALRGVLLDLTMPGLGGEATFREIRRRWPTLPVVVSSGYVPEEGELGNVPFLAKPYRPSDLLDVFRKVLEPGTTSTPTA